MGLDAAGIRPLFVDALAAALERAAWKS